MNTVYFENIIKNVKKKLKTIGIMNYYKIYKFMFKACVIFFLIISKLQFLQKIFEHSNSLSNINEN
jgi:hypothetical protein